jgi:hypothetical protein
MIQELLEKHQSGSQLSKENLTRLYTFYKRLENDLFILGKTFKPAYIRVSAELKILEQKLQQREVEHRQSISKKRMLSSKR